MLIGTPLPDGGTQPDTKPNKPPRMPIRRNLSNSLPPPSPQAVARSQAFEDPLPLQCTPEPAHRTAQPPGSSTSTNLNMTFEVDNDDQTSSNATIILSRGTPPQPSRSANISGPSLKRQTPEATRGNLFPFKRKHMAALHDERRTNPTYMGVKPAVQGKRKFNRSIREETTQEFSAPKRVKKDTSLVQRPLRVQRFIGSENRPGRVVRSISEGNLNLLGAQKSRSFLQKTSQQIRRVVKQM